MFRFLASELHLVFGRRRNVLGLGVLTLVPIAMSIGLRLDARGGILGPATNNGPFIALGALMAEMTVFLPLAIAMIAGDSVAGEAQQGTLRYLLTVPAGRTRVLLVKFASILIGALAAVALVAVVGLVGGAVLFGVHPIVALSGTELSYLAGVGRVGLAVGYLAAGLTAIGAVGLFVSTLTEQPLAATITTMVIVALCWIAEGFQQLAWLQPWLLTHWFLDALDVMRDPVLWTNIGRGLGLDAGYAVVFLLGAWARLTTKDVTS